MRGGSSTHAICVSRDPEVGRVVGAALSVAGVSVEYFDVLPSEIGDVALIVVDRVTRQAASAALRTLGAPVVVVGDDLDDDGLITLMLEAPVSHLVGDLQDRDLGITSEKLVTGEIFGLEKYITAGAKVGERVVVTQSDKRAAIGEVASWAEAVGARIPIVHRLVNVVDELLMNALREAIGKTGGAVLRWGSDDRTVAISVSDPFGVLRQRDVIDHVRRARDERGRPQLDQAGAGLGLYLVLANVASLIVNVDPGHQTEVVCLFDLARAGSRSIASGVRSLHVFSATSG